MLLQETKKYEMFKNLECNRPLHEGNVKKIQKSIMKKNLLAERPILVDKNYHVIDGKHRLEVARRMGVSIWYQVTDKADVKDMILLNNNLKTWNIPSYLNYYAKEGLEHYVALENFVKKHQIDVNVALHLLNANRDSGFYSEFKEGGYEFPDHEDCLRAIEKKRQIDEIVDFIKKKTSGNKVYLDRVTFYSALVSFVEKENFSYDVFFKKLQYKLSLIRPCSKRGEYLAIFKEIYNWKNKGLHYDDE